MVATTALFSVLTLLGAVAALPAEGNRDFEERDAAVEILGKRANLDLLRRSDGVAVGSQAAPDEVVTVGNIVVGSRGNRQEWDLGANRNCVVKKWGKHNKDGEGWDAYIYCMRTIKPVTWDIRRIGDKPTRCDLGSVAETWTVSHQETTSTSVSIDIGGAFEFFTAGLSSGYSDTVTDSSSHAITTTCGDFRGIKCTQGGHALIESRIQEGWVHLLTESKGKDGETSLPDWIGKDDDANGNGFWAGGDWNHYKWNNMYPTGWDTWETTGDSCTAMGSIFYGTRSPV